MLNLKQALAHDINEGLKAAQAAGKLPNLETTPPIVVARTDNPEHGDYASPIALSLTKQLQKPPLDIVSIVAEHMPKKEYIGKIDAAPPGFLNIRINPGWFQARLDDVIEDPRGLDLTAGSGQKVNLEFISANPTGPLTLGNARTAFSVDTLGNVLTAAGYNVTREYYINDAGEQIKRLGESVLRRILQAQGETIDFPEELYQGEYIKEVATHVAEYWRENEGKEFEQGDLTNADVLALVSTQTMHHLLSDIKKIITDDLRIRFDVWTSEAALRQSGLIEKVLERLRADRHTYKKEGAEYLKTTAFGDSEDRVLVKTSGEYAYITPDIAYHHDKFERGFDHIFTFVGADHQGHGPKLLAAMQALGHDTKKLHIVSAQWMRFVSGGKPVKLSKRQGMVVTPTTLIEEVGYDAARFFMVQHALTTHMDFDLDLARERSERNPVYYVQYAYVRLQSIVRKAKEEGAMGAMGEDIPLTSRGALTHTGEVALMRELYRLPEVVSDITHTFEVQALAYYALDLARAVHFFYKHVPVLKADDKILAASRLQLVLATRTVLETVLDLLGISKPDVM